MDANPAVAATAVVDPDALAKDLQSGAAWFFWIAVLSLVNSAMAFHGSERSFLVGLAVTQLVDAAAQAGIASGGPAALRYVALGIDLAILGVVVAPAALTRRHPDLYAVGMGLYALDAMLCGVLQLWGHLAFHAVVLFFLWRGLSALRQLRAAAAPAPQVRLTALVR